MKPEEVGIGSPVRLEFIERDDECDYIQAIMMLETIVKNNRAGRPSTFIVPVGPTGYAKRFARLVNEHGVSLKNVTIINMDEYMLTEKELIDPKHPMSFIRFMNDFFYGRIKDELNVPPENRIFPEPANTGRIWDLINKKDGGVDICFGGFGVDGHIAFNEPPLYPMEAGEFAKLPTRVLPIYYTTQVTNSLWNGANYRGMPRYCVSIGMREILSSKKCCFFACWGTCATVIRQVLHGPVTSEVPGSLLQTHPDCTVYTTRAVLNIPLEI